MDENKFENAKMKQKRHLLCCVNVFLKRFFYQVIRRGGNLGESIIHWRVKGNVTDDVMALEGSLNFTEGQTLNDIIINVISDDVPEFDEHVEIELYKVVKSLLRYNDIIN